MMPGSYHIFLKILPRQKHSRSDPCCKQMVPNSACASCARIYSLDAVRAATAARTTCRSWRASVLRGRPEPGLRSWECSTDNFWKQQHTNMPNMRSNPSICPFSFPQAYKRPCLNGWSCSTGVRTRRRYLVVPYCRVNVANTVHLSKHVTACRVTTVDAKTGLLSALWSPMTVTNESLTLLPPHPHIIILVPMNTALEGVAYFTAVY